MSFADYTRNRPDPADLNTDDLDSDGLFAVEVKEGLTLAVLALQYQRPEDLIAAAAEKAHRDGLGFCVEALQVAALRETVRQLADRQARCISQIEKLRKATAARLAEIADATTVEVKAAPAREMAVA